MDARELKDLILSDEHLLTPDEAWDYDDCYDNPEHTATWFTYHTEDNTVGGIRCVTTLNGRVLLSDKFFPDKDALTYKELVNKLSSIKNCHVYAMLAGDGGKVREIIDVERKLGREYGDAVNCFDFKVGDVIEDMDVITQRRQLVDAIKELNRAFHLDENTPFPETAELLTRMFENFNDILLEDYKNQVLTEGVYMVDDDNHIISLDGDELPGRPRAQSNNPYKSKYKSAVGIVRGNSKMHLVGRGASYEAQYMALPIIMNNTIDSLEKLKSRLRDHDSKKLSNLIYKLTNMLGDIYDFGADLVGNTYERDIDVCKGLDIMLESCLRINEKVDALSRLDESCSPYKYDMLLESLTNEDEITDSDLEQVEILGKSPSLTTGGERYRIGKGNPNMAILVDALSKQCLAIYNQMCSNNNVVEGIPKASDEQAVTETIEKLTNDSGVFKENLEAVTGKDWTKLGPQREMGPIDVMYYVFAAMGTPHRRTGISGTAAWAGAIYEVCRQWQCKDLLPDTLRKAVLKGEDATRILSSALSSKDAKTMFINLLNIIKNTTINLQDSIENLYDVTHKYASLQPLAPGAQKLSQAFAQYGNTLITAFKLH